MAEYNFRETEQKWQQYWEENKSFRADEGGEKEKFYVLDMFPYPSGAGLHVGHPLGYIGSDIMARYKRIKGYNVLHPMGFDAFGLPAEQYAIQTGQHPAITTEENITRYKEQLKNMGFAYDWDREVRTCEPDYYRWTQWIFQQLFESYYDKKADKAMLISELVAAFEADGNAKIDAACDEDTPTFTASDWAGFTEKEQSDILLKYRLTFLNEAVVNWCPALGTVLSNDEVKDGYSERGGHPVERKKMMQWSMRITAYAERMLNGLENIDWPEPIKEIQRNWIGKSRGAELDFDIVGHDAKMRVFTTRIDTIYGVTYMAVAPESDWVDMITTPDQKEVVSQYVEQSKARSERDRMADVKTVSGEFTGAYAINPFTEEQIPIFVADYVLAGYGTGAVMAVPGHDDRDHRFARYIALKEGKDEFHYIKQVIEGPDVKEESFPGRDGLIINSGFLSGMKMQEAMDKAIAYMEEKGIGQAKINYRLRDAIFSRQRYWGEPVPVFFKDGIPTLLPTQELPLELPEVDKYLPTEDGEPPLARASNWKTSEGYELEKSTMPGWAGSSWYLFRYMDPKNETAFVGTDKQAYWKNVDLYIGGSEHATGHLLYSRFWTKFLFDRGFLKVDEPFQKLVNQGMIQGTSAFVYRDPKTNTFYSKGLKKAGMQQLHVDVSLVRNDVLDIEGFKNWRSEYKDASFELENGQYICGSEVEKMSKSKYNVVNPDDIIDQYGADTLRLYEMFLGPLEQSKPWNTNGIDGVFKFIRKFWSIFHNDANEWILQEDQASEAELKVLHKTLKKIEEDTERLSFNTAVSTFMICVNDLGKLKSHKRAIMEPLIIALSPYAPHLAEELWRKLGHQASVSQAIYPQWEEKYVVEAVHTYPISINGKMRHKMEFSLDMPKEEIEKQVLEAEQVQKWLDGKSPKKMIVVPGKIVNVVV
ncbi:MAG: leucine--tRNA ligase [Cyclobacteriaceae bacterium]|nr:leucine--tRNA ligase [Cyclobacteriaceae bacterium]MCH8515690.1 leucine--tRNA ligase [Cyclobacteriaceae bacterium]